MTTITANGIKYHVIRELISPSDKDIAGVKSFYSKYYEDFVLLKHPVNLNYLICRTIPDADLIEDDGYLYWSC